MGTQGSIYATYGEWLFAANGTVAPGVLGSDDTSGLQPRGSYFEQRGSDHWGQNGVCHAKWADIPENAPQYRAASSGQAYALQYEGKSDERKMFKRVLHWGRKGLSVNLGLQGPFGYPKANRWDFFLVICQQVYEDGWQMSSVWLNLENRGDGTCRFYFNFPSGIAALLVPTWPEQDGRWGIRGGDPDYWWSLYAHYILEQVQRHVGMYPPTKANVYLQKVQVETIDYPEPDKRVFLFGEPSWNDVWSRIEHHDAFEMLKEGAYLTAVQQLPQLNQNSIANILEVVSFINDLRSGALSLAVDVPTKTVTKRYKTTVQGRAVRSSLQGQLKPRMRTVTAKMRRERAQYGRALKEVASDSWLQYRYAYGTTTMDFQEVLNFVQRKRDLTKVKEFTLHGSSSLGVEGRSVTMRCRIPVVNHFDDAAHNMWDTLYVYGLQPDLYILWDMIPYSFIVDWFLPVGDFAAAMDAMNNLHSSYWSLGPPTYSLKYDSGPYNTVKCYTRWVGSAPPMLLNGVWANHGTSYRTMAKRGADTVSLII